MTRTPVARIGVALVSALALGGCARAGDSVAISSGEGRVPSAADDLAAAQRVVLSAADVPGWDVDPGADANATSAEAATSFQECAGASVLGDEERTAQSPGFRRGSTTALSSIAMVAGSEAEARSAMGELARPELGTCLTGLFRAVLERDLELPVVAATTERLSSGSAGDESVTWRTTLEVTAAGRKHPAYSDLTFVRSGRALASLFDFQVGEPFPAGERRRLVDAMAARMGGI